MTYQDVRNRIVSFQNKECGKGASLAEIDSAASVLGVAFSESYRQFLRDFGWARFAHQEIYGLGSDVPGHLELVRNTEVERREMRPFLLTSLVPLMNDGAGNHYCLDTRNMHDAGCPVVFWDHELGEDQEPERISDSFEAWLSDMLNRL